MHKRRMRSDLSPLEGTTAMPEAGVALKLRPGRDIGHGFFFALLHAAWDGGAPSRARGAWTQIVLQAGAHPPTGT